MAVYKVHVKTNNNSVHFITNATTLSVITFNSATSKYEVLTPNEGLVLEDSIEAADKTAREKITVYMAKLGVVPSFIYE